MDTSRPPRFSAPLATLTETTPATTIFPCCSGAPPAPAGCTPAPMEGRRAGLGGGALLVCPQMLVTDQCNFPLAFRLCSLFPAFREGARLHSHVRELGLAADAHSLNAVLALCFDGGRGECARRVFGHMPQRTVSSWTALMVGLECLSQVQEAMQVFRGMLDDGLNADEAAIVGALCTCSQCACLEFGASVHAHSIVSSLKLDLTALGTTLVDMYAKSGAIHSSRSVCERGCHSGMCCLAVPCSAGLALKLFNETVDVGVKPTSETTMNVLVACGHAGLVEEGWKCFTLMKEVLGIQPRTEHYECMMDLLGQAGLLAQTLEFMEMMPVEPSRVIWRSLLGAASTNGGLKMGELANNRLASLEDAVAGDYVMLANLYAKFNCWEGVGKVRTRTNASKLRKVAGYSCLKWMVWLTDLSWVIDHISGQTSYMKCLGQSMGYF